MSDSVMDLLRAQHAPQGAPPTAAPGGDAQVPPMGGPLSTPEPQSGRRESAMVNVGMAMDLLEQSLPSIGAESEEGQKLVAALRALTGVIGPRRQKAGELQTAEILQLLQQLPQGGGATPEMKAMAGMPAVPGMAGGGGPSPAMPPMPGAGAGPMPQMPGAGGPPGMPPMGG